MINFIIGIVLILFTVISVVVSIVRTPDNLVGYYGLMYWIIAAGGIVGGIMLVLGSGVL